ncbi:carbohydrate ABC transporter membrane protein 1, CUT1 family [Jatrophihabitans endophyticus]|uniref:Carbohydrate ABC transporter membrane protein 1, CUT1 family n=1 Tax=Jatrophihabitans endophyticus TaxID=1206085 RepID=A0A1M5S6K0_9ACTN|nr:sugar ABC transporter permease [Jatrophihabitans endophyticus]SHH33543.1 carbohydrate ABC transporter membrane protein 1, CUT1 family [Jatrophihabitans endophyticus]
MHASTVILASTASQAGGKLFGVIATVTIFVAILLAIFAVAGRVTGRLERPLALVILVAPAVLLSLAGLVVPAIKTIATSFTNEQAAGQKFKLVDGKLVEYKTQFIGLDNYTFDFTDSETLHTLLRTVLWVVIVPIVTVAIGLLLALLMDRMKRPGFAKTVIFLPTAISFVGASLIWALVYDAPVYEQDGSPGTQTGLLSKLAIAVGWKHPPNWLLDTTINTYLLMLILIWIEVGFAMVVLGAALKAIPDEIIEAARLDGAHGATLFRTVQIPMIRNTLVVVATTVTIAALKIFDIVFTVSGGNNDTDVLANKMYTDLFVTNQTGRGSSLAVILFLCVVPLVAYNVVQMRRERARR